MENTWGADFEVSMKPNPEDIVVKGKLGLCGFESTNLDFILRQHRIETVALGGFLTNCCVESVRYMLYSKSNIRVQYIHVEFDIAFIFLFIGGVPASIHYFLLQTSTYTVYCIIFFSRL